MTALTAFRVLFLCALVSVLSRMEQRGISIDRQILSRLSGELAQGAAALEDEIYALAGERLGECLGIE